MDARRFGSGNMKCMIVGIAKSGTHALQKAVRELGVDASEHSHTCNYHLAENNKVAYVVRNPRNVLISAMRYKNHQIRGWEDTITDEKLVDLFFDFFNCAMPGVYISHEKWLTSKAHVVKFEGLIDRSEIPGLAGFLGVPNKPISLEGGTYTWTGELSDWQRFWTPGIDKVWRDEGMVEIERQWGYVNG